MIKTDVEKQPNGFRAIRLGELPKEWQVVKLSDAVKFSRKPRGLSIGTDSEIPFIPMEYIPCEQVYARRYDLKKLKEIKSGTFFTRGDLLLAKITPSFENGKQCVVADLPSEFGYATTEVWPLHQTEKSSILYIHHYLKRPDVRASIASMMEGSTGRQRVPKAVLQNLDVALPPVPEQQNIAAVLGVVQKAKEKTEEVIRATKDFKKSLMKHLFRHGPVPVKDVESVSVMETDVGLIPREWKVVPLREVAELITKGSSPAWQGFQYCKRGVVFIRSQNVGPGKLELSGLVHLPVEFNQSQARSVIQTGDLLVNIVGASIGRAAIASDSVDGGNLNQAVALVRLKTKVEPYFVMSFLLTYAGQAQLHRQKKEIARANLSLQDIGNLAIPLPPRHTQRKVCRILSAMDSKIDAEEKKEEALGALFRTLLYNLMTGKVRVTHLEL